MTRLEKWDCLSFYLRKARILADTGGVNNPLILKAVEIALMVCDSVIEAAIAVEADEHDREAEELWPLGEPPF